MTLDLTKPVQTRDGRKVRIYATDAGGDYPVHGAIQNSSSNWVCQTWTATGRYDMDGYFGEADLINTPPRITGWVNVYKAKHVGGECLELVKVHPSKEEALALGKKDNTWLGVIYIDTEIQQ